MPSSRAKGLINTASQVQMPTQDHCNVNISLQALLSLRLNNYTRSEKITQHDPSLFSRIGQLSVSQNVQPGSGVHSSSYAMGTGGKAAGALH